jgi:hypothetical protein
MMCRFDNESHERAEQRLCYDLENPGTYHNVKKDMEPETGRWWLYCELAKAKWWTHDQARAKELETRYEATLKKEQAAFDAQIAMFRTQSSRQ